MPRRPPVHAPLSVTTYPRPPFATSIVPDTRTPKQGAIHRRRPTTTPLLHCTPQALLSPERTSTPLLLLLRTVLLQQTAALLPLILHRTSTSSATTTTHQERDDEEPQQHERGQQGERQRGRRYTLFAFSFLRL